MSQTQGPCSKPPQKFTVRIRSPTKCFPFKWLSQTVECLHKKKVQPPVTSDRSMTKEKDKKFLVLPYQRPK